MDTFFADIDRAVVNTKEMMLAVRNTAISEFHDEMQTPMALGGRMRIDTGFLRASLYTTTSLSTPPVRFNTSEGKQFTYDPASFVAVLLGADLDEVITLWYTANYARFREYGTRHQSADRFVALAAQTWPQKVSRAVEIAKGLNHG